MDKAAVNSGQNRIVTDDVSEMWPFPERREPSLDNPDYLGSRALVAMLKRTIATELAGKKDLDILDVGCGQKPFYPFFKSLCRSYVGTDIIAGGPVVDIVCPVEKLLVPDKSADVVLCLSVLEHVDDPAQAVKELFRVLRDDGVVFASTHGCFPWHPYPQDHWRWTQTGLPILFRKHGGFSSVVLSAPRGTVSGMFFLLAHYAHTWSMGGSIRRVLHKPLVSLINLIGRYLDSRTPSLRDVRRHVTAIPEFFVVARKT